MNKDKDNELTDEEVQKILDNIQKIFKGGVRELNPEKRTEAMKRYFELRINSYRHNKL